MTKIKIFQGTKPLGNEAQNIKFTPTDKIQATTVQDAISEVLSKGGVPIVDSVDKLDTNAENGNLAAVSSLKTEEIEVEDKFSVRDIYVKENPDCEPLIELKLKVPETWPTSDLPILFGQKGYNSFDELLAGNSLVLVLTSTGVNIEIYINGEDGGYSSILSDSVNEELLNEVNSTISSWGGIVFYGTVAFGSEPSFIALTKSQIDYVDSIIGGYVTGTHIETIEIHTDDIYFKEFTGWRKINDVKIVDSVDKLDKNAPQGSLATIAVNTGGEVTFSELYQPTSDEVNTSAGVVDTTNLSSVSRISINSSYDTSVEPQYFVVYLFSKDVDLQGGVGQIIWLAPGAAMIMNLSTQENNEFELFTPNEDGTITVNEGSLATINNLLSSTEFVYGGVMQDAEFLDPSYADVFYKSSSGEQKTDLYIKDVEGWKLYKDTLPIPRIGIVNDLTTGGTEKALSAEMGKVLSEKISPLDSTSKLSDNDPIGTLRTVVFANEFSSSNFVEPSTFISKVDRVWEINFRENPYATVAQKFSSWSLRNKLGSYISISANRPSIPGNLYDITYSENYGASKTLCGYSINSGINSIDYDNLASLNELLKNGEYFSNYISGAISLGGGAYRYGVDELLTAAKDAEIYNWKALACIRTSGGWSIIPEVVNNLSDGGSTEPLSAEMGKKLSETISELSDRVNIVVDSIDWLPEDAEVGDRAFVLDIQEGKVPLTISYKNGQSLGNINIYAPEKSDIIVTETITITFQAYVSSAGGYIPLSIIIGPPPASFNSDVEWGLFVYIQRMMGGKLTLASYDSEGNRTAFKQSSVDTLLSELSSYYYSPSGTINEGDEDTINSFFSVNGEIKTPILFTKNTLKWGEYDKATKDKVATLESKVAELESKIQELLQS